VNKLLSYYDKHLIEAGCDEAGRGCLAGPVVAASVILPKDFTHEWLNDSKQLSEKKRQILRPIIEKEALAWAVSFVDEVEIDQINILNASIKAMHLAVDLLTVKPESLLIDGNRFHAYPDIPHLCIIKGDAKYLNIAAASILAKTHRDEFMEQIHLDHTHYAWNENKGYPTKKHRAAIFEFGPCHFHRKTFTLLSPQQTLAFIND
jgi:ribonuclease HII